MENTDSPEPEHKDVSITLKDVPGAIAKAIDPTVSIEDRVASLALVLQLLERHDRRDRSQFKVGVLLTLIAIGLSVAAIIVAIVH